MLNTQTNNRITFKQWQENFAEVNKLHLEALQEYVKDYCPVEGLAAIAMLSIYACENDEIYLTASDTDALKGLVDLLQKIQKGQELKEHFEIQHLKQQSPQAQA